MATTAPNRDDRKTAAIFATHGKPHGQVRRVEQYHEVRAILRDGEKLQGGTSYEHFINGDVATMPVFFLDGAEHKARRATIARYFTPKAISGRYARIIEQVTAELLGKMREQGEGQLDAMAFELAVAVAGDIVGLNETNRTRMARRLALSLSAAFYEKDDWFSILKVNLTKARAMLGFWWFDLRPTIAIRRKQPQEDIISQLIALKSGLRATVMECLTYASAGMVTTREFIVMSAWHLFEKDDLRARFLAGDEDEQFAILLEILRLEPVAAYLYRRDTPPEGPKAVGGALHALCLREANADTTAVGACPHALDPDRAPGKKGVEAWLSFGDGAHHCPGKMVALHETRGFLDALLRVPGIRLHRAPDIGWSSMLQSYELRNAIITCDTSP